MCYNKQTYKSKYIRGDFYERGLLRLLRLKAFVHLLDFYRAGCLKALRCPCEFEGIHNRNTVISGVFGANCVIHRHNWRWSPDNTEKAVIFVQPAQE